MIHQDIEGMAIAPVESLPGNLEAALEEAQECLRRGDLDQLEAICHSILATRPEQPSAVYLLGAGAFKKGNWQLARELLQKAVQLEPNNAYFHNDLGVMLSAGNHTDAAIEHYRAAVELKPDYADAFRNLGDALREKGALPDAIAAYQKALQQNSGASDAYNNLGVALKNSGRIWEAVEVYQKALEVNPQLAEAYINLGTVLKDQGLPEDALTKLRRALELQPDNMTARSNLLLNMHYHAELDGDTISTEHLNWGNRYLAEHPPAATVFPNDSNIGRRLRIGYVSADFRRHSVAFFVESLLAAHDREKFEIFCYSNVQRPDRVTSRFQQLADQWRVIYKMSDEQASGLIRRDKIDILIDLSGHTEGNRLPLFALKPAPVQVTYLGYPDTTGLAAIDYRITDAWADPPGMTDRLHSEKLVRLPYGFLCYQPPGQSPGVAEPPFLQNGRITLGSFNNRAKITPDVVAAWAKIMHELPESNLLLKAQLLSDPKICRALQELFAQHGISAERLEFLGFVSSLEEHLQSYRRVDIALDTFPYNGTTTTCEALWMGVPVIVLAGDRHISRVGVSLLSSLGLAEWIAESPDDYVHKAVQLTKDPQRLIYLRQNLRSIMKDSALTDAKVFTRSLERAYRNMWRQRCIAQPQTPEVASHEEPSPGAVAASEPSHLRQQAVIYSQQGEALFRKGQMDQALQAFRSAVEIDPGYIVPYNNLGVLFWRCGDAVQSLQWLVKALGVEPKNEFALRNLNDVLQQLDGKGLPELNGLLQAGAPRNSADSSSVPRPDIRILHHMARSGGTIISKCLGCMKDVVMLSEVHPLGGQWFNPLEQAHNWFGLFDRNEFELLQKQLNLSFTDMVWKIHEKCLEHGKILLIRDWSHLDFTAVPFLEKPSERLQTAEELSSAFSICHMATVRHPVDQWLSLRSLAVMQGKIQFPQFLEGYLRFAEHCREIGFVRYEDFTADTTTELQKICQILRIPYDPSFNENWSRYTTITGDINSLRGRASEIKPVERRAVEEGLLEQFAKNPDYLESIRILGYDHPTGIVSNESGREKHRGSVSIASHESTRGPANIHSVSENSVVIYEEKNQLLNQETIQNCQQKFGLTYHVPYAFLCQQKVGFEGKHVLEVGGSLPAEFVLDYLKAKSWAAVESPAYEDALAEAGGLTHKGTILNHYKGEANSQEFVAKVVREGKYNFYLGNIENLPDSLFNRFDVVFSIAAFEHIQKFPQALARMHAALKPGGILFSMFSPIWSASDGHHLPRITDKSGKIFDFRNCPIPPWAHLLMRPPELVEHMRQFTDRKTAGLIGYYVYNSPHINRFFTEDYRDFVKNSRFGISEFSATFPQPLDPQLQLKLERSYAGRTHFANNGILMVLQKPQKQWEASQKPSSTVRIGAEIPGIEQYKETKVDSANEKKTLLFYHNTRQYYRAIMFSEQEVFCGPDCETTIVDGKYRTLKTPAGVFDVKPILEQLSPSQHPELVVVKGEATCRNFPINLKVLSCPKVLMLGDTQHLRRPIRTVLEYARQEGFDYIVSGNNRRHLHYFKEAGFAKVFWIPAFDVSTYEQPHHEKKFFEVSFVGQVGEWHPYRKTVLQFLKTNGVPLQILRAPQAQAAEVYAQSQINLNISLNGDLNFRVFEVLSSGGFLLTDRLSPEAGLEMIFKDGEHLVCYDSAADLLDKIRYYRENPSEAERIARKGYQEYKKHHSPELKIQQLMDYVFRDRLEPLYEIDKDKRSIYVKSPSPEALFGRVAVYEFIQELHRTQAGSQVLFWPSVDAEFVCDALDLPRLQLFIKTDGDEIPTKSIQLYNDVGLAHRLHFLTSEQLVKADNAWDVVVLKASDLVPAGLEELLTSVNFKWLVVVGGSAPLAGEEVGRISTFLISSGFERREGHPLAFYWKDQSLWGGQLYLQGRTVEAVKVFRKVLSREPTHLNALNNLGMIYFQLNQLETAEQFLLKAVSLDRSDFRAISNLAHVYIRMQRFEVALGLLQEAISIEANDPSLWGHLGCCFEQLDRPGEALEAYRKAAEQGGDQWALPETAVTSLKEKMLTSAGNVRKSRRGS